MENRNISLAFDIIGKLLQGEHMGEKSDNTSLYEAYNSNMEVYDLVTSYMKSAGLRIYEYNNSIYVCPLEGNKAFGYTNEELKEKIGLRLNKELYLCFFITYVITVNLLKSTSDAGDYIRVADIIKAVDAVIPRIIDRSSGVVMDEAKSVRSLAVMWDDLPVSAQTESMGKASRGSKSGFVKLLMNFYLTEDLFILNEDRYYPTGRFYAIGRGYFNEYRSEIMDKLMSEQ
jgi:hypothetical protein